MTASTPPVDASAGWASRTLDRALWQSSVLGLASWQLVVGLFVASRAPELVVGLALGHVVLAACAVAAAVAVRSQLARVLWFGALMALLTADLTITTDPLATTVLCMTFVVSATPFLVLRPLLAAAVTTGGVGTAAALAVLVGPGERVALAITVPALCYALGAGLFSASLRRFAAATDADDLRATADQRRLSEARVAAQTTAELARTLHDTVVNTLAVIASGSLGRADEARVRARCREDVASLGLLGSVSEHPAGTSFAFSENLALNVEWSGFDEHERTIRVAALGGRRRSALNGVVRELLLNVEKHAGTDRVAIEVTENEGSLRVKVEDAGRGFDLAAARGLGLADSVLRRAAAAGIDVAITTAPGQGTSVVLQVRIDGDRDGRQHDADGEVERNAERILRSGTWGWCLAVTAASLASGAVGTGTFATFGSVALVGLLSAAAWFSCRGERPLTPWLTLVIAAATPVAFVLGFVGANLDGGDPRFWQAIGLTPLLVILLTCARQRTALVLACAGLGTAATVAALIARQSDSVAAGSAVANACIQLAQLSVWIIFAKILDLIASHAAASRREADQAHADRAALEAAVNAQRLWRDAQVHTAVTLLRQIAEGEVSASDPVVQDRAGTEEHHLRQLLMLSPELVHLGPWLALSIGECRNNNVRASVRSGDVDLPDADVARALGSALVDLLRQVDGGTHVVIAHFGGVTTPVVTVVGPAGFISSLDLDAITYRSPGCQLRRSDLSAQELIELVPIIAA